MDVKLAKALQVEAAQQVAISVAEIEARIARLEAGQAQILEMLQALLAARPAAHRKG